MSDNPFPELTPYLPGRTPAKPRTEQAASTWLDRQMREQRQRDLRETILNAPEPDAVARTTRLARQVQEPPAYVEGNEDSIEAMDRAARVAVLAQHNPVFGLFAAKNPRAAAMAQDDTESLGALGTAWDILKNAPGRFGGGLAWRVPGAISDMYNAFDELKDLAFSPLYAGMSALSEASGVKALDPARYLEAQQKRRAQEGAYFRDQADAQSKAFRGANAVSEGVLQGVETAPMTLLAVATRNPRAAAALLGGVTGAPGYLEARSK